MKTLLPAGLALLALCSSLFADVEVITCDRDTTIYSEDGLSNAKGPDMPTARTNSGLLRRGLMHFDLSAIPAGSTINSVSVAMRVTNLSIVQNGLEGALHRLTTDWGEGTSNAGSTGGGGATATTGDATWSAAILGTSNWTTAGGDFVSTASVVITPNLGNVTFPSTAALVADVQGWLDNGANYGWMVLADETVNGTGVLYRTRESINPPTLTVDYTPPAASAWTDLGLAKAGTNGDPVLVGGGPLTPLSTITIDLSNTIPGTTAWLCYGISTFNAPFFGGTLVPNIDPPGGAVPLPTSGAGTFSIADTWPSGVPSDFSLYLQYWIEDPGALFGWASSNAVQGTTP